MVTEFSGEALLNAIPMPVFIVDEDLVVNNVNHTAMDVFNLVGSDVLSGRWGSALQCVRSGDHPSGCGYGPACKDCTIRNSVADCFAGPPVIQRKASIALKTDGFTSGCELLISVNQIMDDDHVYALFMIEDMAKLDLVNATIPSCMHCKRLREDGSQWTSLEDYLDRNLHIKLSHCICEQCLGKYYPDIAAKRLTNH